MSSSSESLGTSRLEALASLRLLVAYLGEKDQFAWWPTSFLSATGRRFLEYNFPRTVLSAGVSSVAHAAKELHDQRIGRAGAYHLFRLPHALEQDIHALLAAESGNGFAELVSSGEQALAKLAEFAEEEDVTAQGPVRVSGLRQLTHRPSIRKAAAHYRNAFESGQQTFPYFAAE
jgi:hypothetical protein